jgi:hypothetical protein
VDAYCLEVEGGEAGDATGYDHQSKRDGGYTALKKLLCVLVLVASMRSGLAADKHPDLTMKNSIICIS